MVYLGKESGARKNVKVIADKTRMWKGRLLHILAVENQTYVDYRMILRNMLTESLSYHKQWKRKKAVHEREEYAMLEKGAEDIENGETTYKVCKAWEDHRLRGIEEGREEGMRQHLIKLVCKKLQKNKSAVVIAEEVEEDLSEVEKILEAQKKVGSYDIEEICKAMG